jgi:AcrR family transcriptional regulator
MSEGALTSSSEAGNELRQLQDLPVCPLTIPTGLLTVVRMALREPANDPPGQLRAARDRIVDTGYNLFSRHGVRAIGIKRIISKSGVAKMTFYRYFPSKDDLVLEFLDVRRQRWARDWLFAEVQELASTPRERSLAIFDVLDEWFHSDGYESCALIATLLEFRDKANPVHQEAARQLELIRATLQDQAEQAGTHNPEATAYQMQILMMGAIVSATRGDLDAARRARRLAELLLNSA